MPVDIVFLDWFLIDTEEVTKFMQSNNIGKE